MLANQPLISLIDIPFLVIAFALIVPITVLFIECSAAILPNGSEPWSDASKPRPTVAVLVPAHNEASDISATLETLLPQLTEQDRLIVIADNCTDDTAAVARKSGAIVIERQDYERRGKGYALDFGMGFIEPNPPDVVVVVDADCIVAEGTISRISHLAIATQRPVQSTYLMTQPDKPVVKDLISTLAVKFKNTVRPSGLHRLGLPCLLTGSGMAFPWSVISKISLAGSKTVDDMQLALDLAITGHSPIYCQQAQVTGRLMKDASAKSQRSRWEHGHIETLLNQVPKLLKEYLRQRRRDLLAIALDLCVPPLSLLVLIWVAATGGSLLGVALGGSWISTIVLLIEGVLLLIAIVEGWAKFCRADFPILMLLAVPVYILWKIPLYLAFLVEPQTKWIRTERDAVDTPSS
ncbi:glycosyltransferase family 2 protein [Moorena sp. SIO3H5]|uniref:glycosyltransferase family 2 protein n=1 Tax=Moorena sp. SIO3H5 TaxID=2607834 RepID=UPI0013B83440|nr:glycosyltransferase family 2 protein [Moorena sp. SIO3H5]NEO69386.1 glycosyltransferase family 2 protein [Moorena sp. SIO3H5]